MKSKRITEDFAVSGQITVAEVPQIRNLGFRSIICNRPDGEDIAQPLFESVAEAARNSGMDIIYLPVSRTGPTDEQVAAFATAYNSLEKPILAYSGAGARCLEIFERAFA